MKLHHILLHSVKVHTVLAIIVYSSLSAVQAFTPISLRQERSQLSPPPLVLEKRTRRRSLQPKALAAGGGGGLSLTDGIDAQQQKYEIPPVQVTDPSHPLIQAANKFIYTQSGFYSPADPNVFSDEFVFRGPIVGPLNKKDYLDTMDTFKIYEALPDINPNAFGYSIDRDDPNRVWFIVRNTGTFTGNLGLVKNGPSIPPNGAELLGCPETFSLIFEEQEEQQQQKKKIDDVHPKVKYLSVGYVADRFDGNTNGVGAAAGIFNAIGFPFPRPGPVLRMVSWFFSEVVSTGAKTYSTENLPEWWTQKSTQRTSEGYF